MLHKLVSFGISAAVMVASGFLGPAVSAQEASIILQPKPFKLATGAHMLAFPMDAATALPEQPFGPDYVGYSCTAPVPGIDLPFAAPLPTASVASPGASYLCFLGPEWNGGLANIDPTPYKPTIVADGEDDYDLSFDPPVYAVGLDLLTNADADEEVTVTFEDGSTQVFDDDELATEPNAFEFVGFKSLRPISGVSVDTAGGTVQNEGLTSVHTAAAFRVQIDVKPHSFPNSVNCKSRGKIPVAILSEPGFDPVVDLDPSTLTFGATGDEESLAFCSTGGDDGEEADVNRDGRRDLVCHFYTQKADFCSDRYGCRARLRGETYDGVPIDGVDRIRIVPGSYQPTGGNPGKGPKDIPPGQAKKGVTSWPK